MQGGEYHAAPPVGLQAPLVASFLVASLKVLLMVVSLLEDSGAEEEEAGVASTRVACKIEVAGGAEETAMDVMTGDRVSGAAVTVVTRAAGLSYCFLASSSFQG